MSDKVHEHGGEKFVHVAVAKLAQLEADARRYRALRAAVPLDGDLIVRCALDAWWTVSADGKVLGAAENCDAAVDALPQATQGEAKG
jgi:hypothetical protein